VWRSLTVTVIAAVASSVAGLLGLPLIAAILTTRSG
jgi:hypothetical protein